MPQIVDEWQGLSCIVWMVDQDRFDAACCCVAVDELLLSRDRSISRLASCCVTLFDWWVGAGDALRRPPTPPTLPLD